jgi:hypothetical protein
MSSGATISLQSAPGFVVIIRIGDRRLRFDEPIKCVNEPIFRDLAADDPTDRLTDADREDHFTFLLGDRVIAKAVCAEFDNSSPAVKTINIPSECCTFLDESVAAQFAASIYP